MLKIVLAAAVLLSSSVGFAKPVRVNGYVTKNGTYVAPHYRSSPDSSRSNNYSSQGNYNPYSGKSGTVSLYGSPSYSNPYTPSYTAPPPAPWEAYGSTDAESGDPE